MMKKTLLGLVYLCKFLFADNFTLSSSDLKGQLTKTRIQWFWM